MRLDCELKVELAVVDVFLFVPLVLLQCRYTFWNRKKWKKNLLNEKNYKKIIQKKLIFLP